MGALFYPQSTAPVSRGKYHDLGDALAHWTLNNTVADEGPNSLDMVEISGSISYTELGAIHDGLQAFKDPSSSVSYLGKQDPLLQITGDITYGLLATVPRDGLNVNAHLIQCTGPGGTIQANNALYSLRINNGKFDYFHEHGSGVDALYVAESGPPVGRPFHAMVRRVSNVVTIFLDGRPIGTSGTLTAPDGGTSSTLYLGRTVGGVLPHYGDLASVIVYDRALSDTEIRDVARTCNPLFAR